MALPKDVLTATYLGLESDIHAIVVLSGLVRELMSDEDEQAQLVSETVIKLANALEKKWRDGHAAAKAP